jgi:lysophospholipase L1-like esterase
MPPEAWLLIVIALPLLFAAAELIARGWIRSRSRYFCWPPHSRSRMPLDPSVFQSGDAIVRFDVNRLGERGEAPPRSFDGVYRVLVAGGSAAECYYLDQDSSWPGQLQRLLSRPEACQQLRVRTAHVGNIARSLVPCRAIRHQLEKLLPQLPRNDVAVLMAGASDLVTWLEQRTPAQIDPGGYALDSIFGLHPERSFGWKPGQLALRRALASAQRALLRPIEQRDTSGKRMAANRAMRAGARQILHAIADPKPMLERYEADLREVLRVLKRHSKRVVLVQQMWLEKSLTPEEAGQMWMFAAGRPYKEPVDAYYAHEVVWPLMRTIYDLGGRVAQEEGVEALDLQERVPRDLEHYYDEVHHTPKGCALVARLIADHLTGKSPC